MKKSGKEKLDAARLVAVRIVYAVMYENKFSNEELAVKLENSTLDARDKSFVSALVYGTLSRLPLLDAYVAKALKKDISSVDPYTLCVLRVGLWQLHFAYGVPSYAACDESTKLARYFGGAGKAALVNAVLRKLGSELPPILKPKYQAYSNGMTTEMYGLFKHWYGVFLADKICQKALENISSTEARLNLQRLPEVKRWLESAEAKDLNAVSLPWPEIGISLELSGRSATEITALKAGLLHLQSASAMLVSELCPLSRQKSWHVLDLCAAPGGKSMALREKYGDFLDITATDISEERLGNMRKRFSNEVFYQNIKTEIRDASDFVDTKSYDLVLCDVPCSGLGLLARKPEIRYRETYVSMQRLADTQQKILQNAAKVIKPAGYLFYSTCTLNPQENFQQIENFLQTEIGRNFTLINLRPMLPSGLKKTYDPALEPGTLTGDVTIFPHRDGSDGFYLALLQKNKGDKNADVQ